MNIFYAFLAVLGVVLPFSQFIPWLMENGVDFSLLFQEIADSRIGAFAWLDVVVSAVVLIGFIWYDGNKLKMKRLWLPIAATCMVGVSLGLPLFLLMREMHKAKKKV